MKPVWQKLSRINQNTQKSLFYVTLYQVNMFPKKEMHSLMKWTIFPVGLKAFQAVNSEKNVPIQGAVRFQHLCDRKRKC